MQVFYKKAVLKNFAIFTRKTAVLEFLFNKVAGLHACNFIKKRHENRYFPVNIAKFFRTPTLKNICEWLLLIMSIWLYFSRKFATLSIRNQLF